MRQLRTSLLLLPTFTHRYTALWQTKATQKGGFHKGRFACLKIKRSTDNFVRTPFHTPATQGIVCYTL